MQREKPDPTVSTSYRDVIAEEINPADLMSLEVYNGRNERKAWKNTRYPKIDPNFIVISKDGTLGKIFKVGGLIIGLPSSEGKEILNLNESRQNSVWKRTPIPKEFIELEAEYKRDMRKHKLGRKRTEARKKYRDEKYRLEEKYAEFIDKEFHRREHGLFIKIDEEVVYITGSNYMFLNYYFLTEDMIYPYFRITATHTWWHWAACQADPTCWGELRLKSRRVAATAEAASEALNYMTIHRYSQIPVVSENDRLAKKLFVEKIVKPFKYYPTYFKPIVDDPNDISQSVLEIEFDTPNAETSNISFYPTKAVAYDSTKAHPMSINDEVGKYVNVEFTEYRGNHRDCHFRGLETVVSTGKFFSTAGAFSEGGKSFKYEFEAANPLKRDKLGQTETQLISLFVDVCYTSGGFFDLWGYPIVYDPEEPVMNEDGTWLEYGAITAWENKYNKLKKAEKKSDLNNFLRQQPRKVEHAFREEGGMYNDFDIDNLNNHVDFLNEHQWRINEVVFRGNLEWLGEPYASDVGWKPHPKGRIFTTWIPNPENQNAHSVKEFHGRKLQCPDNVAIGAFGIDGYDIDDTTSGVGSNQAIIGKTKFNMFGAPSNSYFLKYCERPRKREIAFDDAGKVLWFYGMMGLVENNKPRLLEWLYNHGMRGYSMTRPDKKWRHLSDFEKKYGGIPSSKQSNKDQAMLLQDFIADNIGVNLDEGNCPVWFLDLVEEWIRFNVKKRKEFDLSVASGLAELAVQYMPKQRGIVAINSKSGNKIPLSFFSA